MLCPTCRDPLDPQTDRCPAGHAVQTIDGVLRLVDPDFGARLEAFLDGFRELREADGRRIHDPSVFPRLPFAAELWRDPEWRMRGNDLEVIRRLTSGRGPMTVLDIGAWNGWLSHRLAEAGHRVTAVDYFTDELDGLGAHRFYPTRWRPIQLDLRDLALLDERFDLVVLNRCVQFFADPPTMAVEATQRVADNGMLIATGLEFFTDPAARRLGVAALVERLERHGLEPFMPIKGYLDLSDRDRFRSLAVELRPYPQLRMLVAVVRSLVNRRRGRPCFGVWTR
jgi:SAM-dependent methyltransferase